MWGAWVTGTLGALGLAVLVWRGTSHFVQRYRQEGVPLATWYTSPSRHRGHILVELAPTLATMLGLNFLLQWHQVPWNTWLAIMGVTALLAMVAWVDLITHRIPNQLVLGTITWGGIQHLLLGTPSILSLALGVLVGGGLFFLIAVIGRGAMGMGDVKLAAALGALVGFPYVIPALMAGILLGGIAALILLLSRRVGRKDYIAYGPYLALGGWLVYVQVMLQWMPST